MDQVSVQRPAEEVSKRNFCQSVTSCTFPDSFRSFRWALITRSRIRNHCPIKATSILQNCGNITHAPLRNVEFLLRDRVASIWCWHFMSNAAFAGFSTN